MDLAGVFNSETDESQDLIELILAQREQLRSADVIGGVHSVLNERNDPLRMAIGVLSAYERLL